MTKWNFEIGRPKLDKINCHVKWKPNRKFVPYFGATWIEIDKIFLKNQKSNYAEEDRWDESAQHGNDKERNEHMEDSGGDPVEEMWVWDVDGE